MILMVRPVLVFMVSLMIALGAIVVSDMLTSS